MTDIAIRVENPSKLYRIGGPSTGLPSAGPSTLLRTGLRRRLEPEIVLAVGDAAFQKKCLGKMRGERRAGATDHRRRWVVRLLWGE